MGQTDPDGWRADLELKMVVHLGVGEGAFGECLAHESSAE